MTNPVPNPMLPAPYVVQRVLRETHDTFTLELSPKTTMNGFRFSPGQFNMLYVFGVGEVPISISGDPSKTKTLIHTTRTVGTVTKAMYKLKRGYVLGVRGPYGTQWPIGEAVGNDVVVVAGGIGLAPLRPAVYQLLAQREKFGKIVILYGTRTPADILFRKELERWRSRFDLDVHITVDRAMSGWKGSVGVVTTLVPKAPFDPLNTTALVCGPELMMRYTVTELQKRGLQASDIYISMERNMKCGIGLCGHCQWGTEFICKDGPVFPFSEIKSLFAKREL
ncbi:MAG: Ni/Fe hydrogenase subunit gamma [Bacteroidetes bacterium]|nr:MAG: Ni/Fe hydrogenase subunit gamma [Bacteroidota bacterium]